MAGNRELLQSGFIGGELSPRLHGAVDSPLYSKALKTCTNFMVTPQGSALSCPATIGHGVGGQFTLSPAPVAIRYVPPRSAYTQGLLLLFYANKMRVWDINSEAFVVFEDYNLVFNNSFAMAAPGPTYGLGWEAMTGSVTFSSGTAVLADATAVLRQAQGVRAGAGLHSISVGISYQSVQHVQVEVRVNGSVVYNTGLRTVTGIDATPATISGTFAVVTPGQLDVRVSRSGTLFEGGSSRADISAVTVVAPDQDEIATPWGSGLSTLQVVTEPGEPETYIAGAGVVPQQFSFGNIPCSLFPHLVYLDVSQDPIGAAGAIAFANDRLWYANGCRLIGSHPGAYRDFRVGSTAGDAIDLNLLTEGRAAWMRARGDAVFVGTDMDEWSVRDVAAAPFVSVRQESGFGAKAVAAVQAGSQVAYVSADGKQVRALSYSQERDEWWAHDITLAADHMMSAGIRALHVLRYPPTTLVCELTDGTLACCTYGKDLTAWWRRTFDGEVLAATVAELSGRSVLWLAVTRSTTCYLESLDLSNPPTGHGNGPYVDADAYSIPTPTLVTLPPNPQGASRHIPEVWVRLDNTSVPPLVNGERVQLDEDGDYRANTDAGDRSGSLTITQDSPTRTEILAIFGPMQASRS